MAREASTLRTSNPVPEQRTGAQDTADPVRAEEPASTLRQVSFDRLLSVAVLTPGQATLLAVQLLDAAGRSGTADGEHGADTRLGAVTLTPSGDLDVARPRPGEGTPVSELLERLLQNARQLPTHPRPEQLLLLQRLAEAATDPAPDPGARALRLEGELADTLGPGARRRISGQLAALVDAFAHLAPSVTAHVHPAPQPTSATIAPVPPPRAASRASGSSGAGPRRAAPERHAPSGPPHRSRTLLRRRARGRRATIVLLVLAAVLVVGGYVALRGPASGLIGSLGGGGPQAAPGATAPTQPSRQSANQPRRQPASTVPVLAGRHAGRITGVAVQRTGSCRPGALCPVKVTVHLRPASTGQAVTWKVGAARLCTRGISWSAPTTVTVRAGWSTVYASSAVRVPQGRSLALVALTTTPARAQSRPVPVTGSSLHC